MKSKSAPALEVTGIVVLLGALAGCATSPPTTAVEKIVPLGRVPENPVVRLAKYGEPTKKDAPPQVVIDVTWDEAQGESKLYARGQAFTKAELKEWLHPVARSRVDPKTKVSLVSVLIRCDASAPFRGVQSVMQVCADRDVMIDKIALAVESKLATPLPVADPIVEDLDTPEPRKVRVHLSTRQGRCICYVNGKAVGFLPEARAPLYARIRKLATDSDLSLEIDTHSSVAHRYAVQVIEGCRRAKLKNVTFAAPLPEVTPAKNRKK